jgi:hypothetical protein
MADVGKQVLGLMAVGAGLVVLFAPLGAVLIAAAKTGRGRVLAWAFAGSLVGAGLGLAGAIVARQADWTLGALWLLLSAPWASALTAIFAWRRARKREAAKEAVAAADSASAART